MTGTALPAQSAARERRLPRISRTSLAWRLILLALGWSLAVLAVGGFGLTTLVQRAAVARLDAALSESLDNLLAGVSVGGDGQLNPPALTDVRAARVYSGRYWQVSRTAADGTVDVLLGSRSLFDWTLAPPDAGAPSPGPTPSHYDTPGPDGQRLRAAVLETRITGLSAPVLLIAAEDRSIVDRDAGRFAAFTAAGLAVLAAGLIGAVLLQVRLGLRPLYALRREVASVRRGGRERLTGMYPDELRPLAGELNALLDHNEEVVARQRTHVGNLAHALKTPVSVLLAESEAGAPLSAGIVRRQAEAIGAQVDRHLRRARAAARLTGAGERTAVAEVLDELSRTLERIYADRDGRSVRIDWDADDELSFQGERQDFMELAGNLLENACKYGGRRVSAVAEPRGGERLALVVEDDGPGLPEARRAEVMRRGARLDETAPGSGLGLSIVDDLARAYGGEVTLGESRWGGLSVELLLPRAA